MNILVCSFYHLCIAVFVPIDWCFFWLWIIFSGFFECLCMECHVTSFIWMSTQFYMYCCACNNVICNQFYPFKVTLRLVRVGPEQSFIIGLIGPWFPRWLNSKKSAFQTCRRHRFDPWLGKIPWRMVWLLTPVFLPGESHQQSSLAGYIAHGVTKESDTTELLNNNNLAPLLGQCLPGDTTQYLVHQKVLPCLVVTFSQVVI